MTNPHLNPNGIDGATNERYCVRCGCLLDDGHRTVTPHTIGEWHHFLLVSYPAILARDERGKTLEGTVAVPARTVLTEIPLCNSIGYCACTTLPDATTGCLVCSKSVDTASDHTKVTLLDKSSHHNANLRRRLCHIECLPGEFDAVRKARTDLIKLQR